MNYKLLLIGSILCFANFIVEAQEKPNILWITFEDTSPQYIGCYGNEQAKTPNIDRLAEEGVIFNYAYSNGTVCSPSRSTLITGVHTESMGTGHHRSAINIPSNISGFPTYLRQQGYYTTNNSKTDYNTSRANSIIQSSWDASSNSATWRNRPSGDPFFAVFNIDDSHQTRTMHYPFSWYEQNVLSQLTEEETVSMWDIEMPPYFRDTPEMRKNLVRVHNSLSLTDKKIGAILDDLEADGLMGETIIFIYSDHGEGLPRGKGSPNAQGHQVPFVAWFPEKYKDLSPWELGKNTDEVISFVDLAPSMLSLAGAEIPDYMEGRPFLGVARQGSTDHVVFGSRNNLGESPGMERTVMKNNYVYSRIFIPDLPESKFMVYYDQSDISRLARNDFFDGKLNENQSILFNKRRPIEFLYDIENDPWELNNLAEKAEHANLMVEMRTSLYTNMETKRDAHLFPNSELVTLTTPYDDRLNDSKLPIADVMDIVETIGVETTQSIATQIAALEHSHHLVRYWALIGLRMQRSGLEDHKATIKGLLSDTYDLNKVQAAFILYKNWSDADAKNTLNAMAVNDDREIATETMSLIQYLYEDALEFRSTLEAVIAKNQFNPRQIAQNILHFFDGDRLSYSDNASVGIYDAYQYFDFEDSFEDQKGHGDLITNKGKIIYDGVRGAVSQVDGAGATAFGSDFFLGGRFGLTFWIKTDDLSEGQTLISLANQDTTSQVTVALGANGKLKLSVDDQIFESTESNLLKSGQWNYISLSYGFENRWKLGVNGAAQIDQVHPYNPEFIMRGLLWSVFDESKRSSNQARIDDLTVYHFDFDQFHNFNAFGSENVATSLTNDPYHFYALDEDGTDSLSNSNMQGEVTILVDSERGNVLSLDGTPASALVSTSEFRLNDAFTVSTWFNMKATTRWQSVLAIGDASDFVYFAPYAFNDQPYLVVDGTDNRQFFLLRDQLIPTNEWKHLAFTFMDNVWTCYLDGVQVTTFEMSFDPSVIKNGFIGRLSHNTGSHVNGLVDDFAVFHYALTEGEINLLLDKKVESIDIFTNGNVTSLTQKQDSLQLFYSVTPSDASLRLVEWSIEGNSLGASINADGLFVSGSESGSVEITGTAIDGSLVVDTYTIEQDIAIIKVSNIELSTASGSTTITEAESSLQLLASVLPTDAENQNVNWSIADPSLGCTINENGLLTAGSEEGMVTITATASDGSRVSSSLEITIDFPAIEVATIQLSSETGSSTITEAESSLQLLASILPTDAENQNVNWSIADPSLGCTINKNGLLTAGSEEGMVTITATARDGSAVTGSIEIGIDLVPPLSLSKNSQPVVYPNPSIGIFWINNKNKSGIETVSVYDLTGQMLLKINWNNRASKIDLKALPVGIYYLQITSIDKHYSERVIIER